MQSAVESGNYASNSEVVRDALRLWEQREDVRTAELERLKRAYDEGKSSGEGEEIDPTAFLQSLKAERSGRG